MEQTYHPWHRFAGREIEWSVVPQHLVSPASFLEVLAELGGFWNKGYSAHEWYTVLKKCEDKTEKEAEDSSYFGLRNLLWKQKNAQTDFHPDWVARRRQATPEELFRIAGVSGIRTQNGGRWYDDANIETSSPLVTNPFDLLLHERAMEYAIDWARQRLEEHFGFTIHLMKDSTDRKGHSMGIHKDFSLTPKLFADLTDLYGLTSDAYIQRRRRMQWMLWLVLEPLIGGAGKIGSECMVNHDFCRETTYQLSTRADFIMVRHHVDTTHIRPLINTRDEAYADRKRYRRLHVITGDGTMSDWSIILTYGISMILLAMLEREGGMFWDAIFDFYDPVESLHAVSHDVVINNEVIRTVGHSAIIEFRGAEKKYTPLSMLEKLYVALDHFVRTYPGPQWVDEVMEKFEWVVGMLGDDPMGLAGVLDYPTKWEVIAKKGLGEGHALMSERCRELDIKYHEIGPGRGLARILERGGVLERRSSDEGVSYAFMHPPEDTRSWFLGKCVERWRDSLTLMGWNGVCFGGGHHKEFIYLPHLGAGTKNSAEALFQASTLEEFLRLAPQVFLDKSIA